MSRLAICAALAGCAPAASVQRVPGPPPPTTFAEQTHFAKTGRYAEAVSLCHAYAAAYPDVVACERIGTTGEGREIVAVRVHRGAASVKRPLILVEAGIHAGEIEGKDAGFMFLRDLLDGKVAPGALDAADLVFVPCINPDGHERFSPNNRPNQRGPEEMGFRTNGARQNLNRDFAKADSPEIQAILGVFRAHEPVVFVDIHTTDGAKFEHDISVTVGPRAAREDHLDQAAVALADELSADLAARGHLPVTFYPSFLVEDDPSSGFAIGEAPPRFSHAYAGLRGEVGMLVENHSWRTYEHRVHATYDFLRALFERASREAPAWQAASDRAHAADQQLGGTELPVLFDKGAHTREIAFRGYAYKKTKSEISGGDWIQYDEGKPELWNVPLYDEIIVKLAVHVPRAGYYIDGGFANTVAAVLDRHGIRYARVAGEPRVEVEAFRGRPTGEPKWFEGRARMDLVGAWKRETRVLDRGAIFVPIAQPSARLIVHLLDPGAPDSLAAWGELAAAFERKEYEESYVGEERAREMLAHHPELRAEFDAAVAADPALAKSPEARLDWFFQRTPAWDDRTNLLPIYRADAAP